MLDRSNGGPNESTPLEATLVYGPALLQDGPTGICLPKKTICRIKPKGFKDEGVVVHSGNGPSVLWICRELRRDKSFHLCVDGIVCDSRPLRYFTREYAEWYSNFRHRDGAHLQASSNCFAFLVYDAVGPPFLKSSIGEGGPAGRF